MTTQRPRPTITEQQQQPSISASTSPAATGRPSPIRPRNLSRRTRAAGLSGSTGDPCPLRLLLPLFLLVCLLPTASGSVAATTATTTSSPRAMAPATSPPAVPSGNNTSSSSTSINNSSRERSPSLGSDKMLLGLEWHNLCCRTRGPERGGQGREILKHVSGRARPGRLLAILGPSGSGKTTLLNTISGQLPYQPHMRLTGGVYVTEEERPPPPTTTTTTTGGGRGRKRGGASSATSSSGNGNGGFVFVRQEDLFYSQLTVREILQFTSRLRLPRGVPDREKRAAVEEMLSRMGLLEVADTLVGDEKRRGISGGERKRLSLACELLGNPSQIVFADEPTSGLDSFQSYSVMRSLKRLCCTGDNDNDNAENGGGGGGGHTVVVSIHQPRSTVWQMFDDIILLSDGQVIYHGPKDAALPYFERLGYPCPVHFNPAEFMLDLVSIDHSSPEQRQASQARVQALAQAHRDALAALANASSSIATAAGAGAALTVPPPVVMLDPIAVQHSAAAHGPLGPRRRSIKEYMLLSSLKRRRGARHRGPSWLQQFRLLIARQWKQTSRDVFTNGLRALTTVALAAMFGSIFHKLGRTEDAIQERSAVLMHTCINTAMISIVKTLNLFTRERAIVGRERTKGLYDTSAYVLSKVFGELPIDALFPLMFGTILTPLVGLQRDARHLVNFFSALSLQTLTAAALGLSIGALCPSTEAALTMGPSVMVIFILLSGQVGTSNSKIPWALRWVQDVSTIRWGFEALCLNEFEGLEFQVKNPMPLRLPKIMPKFIKISGREVLSRLDIPPTASLPRALAAQSAILLASYLLTYIGLRFRAPRFQPLLPAPTGGGIQASPLPPLRRPGAPHPASSTATTSPPSHQSPRRPQAAIDPRITSDSGSSSSGGHGNDFTPATPPAAPAAPPLPTAPVTARLVATAGGETAAAAMSDDTHNKGATASKTTTTSSSSSSNNSRPTSRSGSLSGLRHRVGGSVLSPRWLGQRPPSGGGGGGGKNGF